MENAIEKFIEDIINGSTVFKTWEDREFVVHSDRDKSIAEWVIRCLANTLNNDSEKVLDAIINQRKENAQ